MGDFELLTTVRRLDSKKDANPNTDTNLLSTTSCWMQDFKTTDIKNELNIDGIKMKSAVS